MQLSMPLPFALKPHPETLVPPPRYNDVSGATNPPPQPAQNPRTCPHCPECNLHPSTPRTATIITLSALSTLSFGVFWISAHFLSSPYADESVQSVGVDDSTTPHVLVKRALPLDKRGSGGSIGGNFMLFFLAGGLGIALMVGLVLGWYLQYRTDRNQRIWMRERAGGRGTIQKSVGRAV